MTTLRYWTICAALATGAACAATMAGWLIGFGRPLAGYGAAIVACVLLLVTVVVEEGT